MLRKLNERIRSLLGELTETIRKIWDGSLRESDSLSRCIEFRLHLTENISCLSLHEKTAALGQTR